MSAQKRTTALSFFIVATIAVVGTVAYLRKDEAVVIRFPAEMKVVALSAEQPAMASGPATYPQASGSDLPADCEQYLEKLAICSERLNAANDTATKLQQTIDDARVEWRKVNDRVGLSATCKVALESFPDATLELGCGH